MKIALFQQTNTANRHENVAKLESNIRKAAAEGAELIVLQELHNGLYFCQTEDTNVFEQAETIPGPSTESFGQLAAELGVVIVLSLFEKRAAGLYHNTAVVLEKDGSIAGKNRKMHIPDDPAYYEKFYFTPGDLVFEPIQTSVGKLGVLVCWDQWYPEAARLMAMAGAELLIYPTALLGKFRHRRRKTRQTQCMDYRATWSCSSNGCMYFRQPHRSRSRSFGRDKTVFSFGEIVLWLVRRANFGTGS
jgi:N-carbamoylputrescine amidase